MRQRLFILCLFCLSLPGLQAQYTPDVLGDTYLSRTVHMPDDYEGEVVCTVIKKPTRADIKQAILYVHGYNDYFFQKELGDSIEAHGYNFYAIDLRKYGRSLLPHQDAFFCKNLNEYFADIDTTLSIMRSEGNERIILMGHSTGGLISSLYLDAKKEELLVDGLILNSPFLDMNMSPFLEKVMIPIVSFIGRIFPRLTVMKNSPSSYAYSLLKQYKGEWTFNTEWKKPASHPKRAGWLSAIHRGQKKVQKGLSLPFPILVLSSDQSFPESNTWNEAYHTSDIVLDVDEIQKYGANLGSDVTLTVIPGGKHDLILSQKPARDRTYNAFFEWLN